MNAAEFKQRFLPFHRKIYRQAFRLMGNAQDAEDMVQETYLKLWTRRDELPAGAERTEAYCMVVARHTCLDALRLRHPTDGLRPAEEPPPETVDRVEERDEADRLMELIAALPEPQRSVMRMRDVEGTPYEEIEAQTGLTAGHIRVLLSRARKKIREQFKTICQYERV